MKKVDQELKKENLHKARMFVNTFHFIDDLLTIDDNGLFLQSLKDIYPPELQLNLEGYLDQLSSLDLDLKKCDRRLEVKLACFSFFNNSVTISV